VRLRDVSAGRLLTARKPWSVNTRHPPLLYSSDTTAGNRRASMPTASSVVSGLSISSITTASCTAFHPLHTSRTVAVAFRETEGSLGFTLPSRLQLLQHLRQQLTRHIRPLALRHRLSPPLCSRA
jgi:hypothetical protein